MVSCIILTYKNFNNIFRSIQSVLDQDYSEIELGVFDDGSENFPRELIEEYIAIHKRSNIKSVVVYGSSENRGTVKNINCALSLTKGDYIIFVPSDDEFFDGSSCTRIVDFFKETNADMVTSYRSVTDGTGKTIRVVPSKHSAKKLQSLSAEEQFKWIAEGAPVAGAGVYYSRRILDKFGGFDEDFRLQEDGPFFLKATRMGNKIYFMDQITYKYMLGNGVSSSDNNNPLLVTDVKRLFEKEVVPYLDRFDFWGKRRIAYAMERIDYNKHLSWKEKICLLLRYPDVILHRKINAY